MGEEHTPTDLVAIALDRVGGFEFERFVNSFFPALVGRQYVPLGGVKDGGGDGADEPVHEEVSRTTSFYQASVGAEVDEKIRRTVARLREFGRDPRFLTYVTARTVKYIDTVEAALTDELDVTIRIRDGAYIASHVNDGSRTRDAFNEHLRHLTDFLKSVGGAHLIQASRHVRDPTVFVFLAQEVERRQGDESIVSAVTDSLILWGLEGTDPDLQRFMTREQILGKIRGAVPAVEQLVAPRLRRRLEVLSSKHEAEGRRVRWYKTDDVFCLPYATRRVIEDENQADEALRLDVLNSLDDRIRSKPREGLGEIGIRTSAEVSLRALQLAFEREGLEFSAFLRRDDMRSHPTIVDSIAAALDEAGESGKRRLLLADAVFDAVRGVLYASRPRERDYLHKLSRTYALLFTLNSDPRLVEYFQDMAGDFYLYVGADQFIRALSERFLPPPDQTTRNTLLAAARAGARLILTEPTLEEVVWNLKTSDLEFKHHVEDVEPHMTYELARNSPKILLRAYLYASLNADLGKGRPKNWPAFVQQFVDYGDLHKPQAFEDMRQYLQRSFGVEFVSRADLHQLVDADAHAQLKQRLIGDEKPEKLADNDALIALAVYGHRDQRRERSAASEFGYRTWWLTSEARILRHTHDLVEAHGDVRYIMRPDFLLNFLTLAPAASEVREAFASTFPSILGITLSRRMPEATFQGIMEQVEEAQLMDDARRGAAMAKLADRLKGDFEKQYLVANADEAGPGRPEAAVDQDARRTSGS